MSESLLLPIAILCYAIATSLIIYFIRNTKEAQASKTPLTLATSIAFIGVCIHLVKAFDVSFIDNDINLSLHSMTILISAILVLIYLLGSLSLPIKRLGVLVYPLTVVSLIFAINWSDKPILLTNAGLAFKSHILISVLAYFLISIAAIQACIYVYQEKLIKKRTGPSALMALPPLQTMETLLFRLLGIGFLLLTLALLSGAVFSQQIFGQAFEFNHHTFLTFMGWCVFTILLFKRVKHGLRGSQAFIWTLAGFILIQLGYFGTKIINESLNLS